MFIKNAVKLLEAWGSKETLNTELLIAAMNGRGKLFGNPFFEYF